MTAASPPPRRLDRVGRRLARAAGRPASRGSPRWAVVLAGGEGRRLRALVQRVCGDDRPKQYAALLGSRSLFQQTLDRVRLAIPAERTVVVTVRRHASYLEAELRDDVRPIVLAQPEDRGTAVGVLLAAHWIAWHDPGATVAVFPTDHFVDDAVTFMRHVQAGVSFVERRQESVLLFGALPSAPETDYGWIEPGGSVGTIGGRPVARVRRFIEKPDPRRAQDCLRRGCLWNTLIFVGTVRAVIELGSHTLPTTSEEIGLLAPLLGAGGDERAVANGYGLIGAADFSRDVLERAAPRLAVTPLPPISWSDLGTPRRLFEIARTLRVSLPWSEADESEAAG